MSREAWLKANADKVREYKRRSGNKAYAKDPEKFKLRQKNWRKKNLLYARARDKKYRQKYAKQRRQQFKAWRESHREYFRDRNKTEVINLANWYVRMQLSKGTHIPPSLWPADLAELKRAKIKLTRLCRALQPTHN
jgi:hypothetical protein